jgi:hypothetical protein
MPTLMQKIRLALRGWNRRREEKNQQFLAQSGWTGASGGGQPRGGQPPSAVPIQTTTIIDIEALVIAHLDASARTTYYLDTESGDVIESNVALDSARYKPVPAASHEDDRTAFLATIESNAGLENADSFRSVLSKDRKLERAWFNFRNDRAIAAIQRWLREHRLK